MHNTPNMSQSQSQPPSAPAAKDTWSAQQYLKYGTERTRAVYDLVSRIDLASPKRIVDLGCGPANSTAVLAARFPGAALTGVDSSADMLARARATLPAADFQQADLMTYAPPPGADLLFSNAVFHWLRHADRIPAVVRLLRTQNAGGVFALQVPDNHEEPSHRIMREAAAAKGSWSEYFRALGPEQRPDLDPIETPLEWYNALIPHCATVDVWHVYYQHILSSHRDIVEWVRATGLQPFLNAIPEGLAREDYLAEYEARLKKEYPLLADGKVMLRYPRLFVVAVKK